MVTRETTINESNSWQGGRIQKMKKGLSNLRANRLWLELQALAADSSQEFLVGGALRRAHNNALKSFAYAHSDAWYSATFANGFAIFPQMPLRTSRRLAWR